MEAHVCAISLWYRLLGLFGLAVIAYLGYLIFSASSSLDEIFGKTDLFRILGAYIFVGLLIVFIPLPVAALLVGFAVSRFSNVGRITASVLTGLFALGFLSDLKAGSVEAVVSTILVEAALGASLWVLLHPRTSSICSRDYREMHGTSRLDRRLLRTPFLWGPAIIIGLLLLLNVHGR